MIVIGLTGSIGTGKSTTAAMFAARGVPVCDSDAVVHRLYEGEAAPLIEAAFPGTVVDGKVDRNRLSSALMGKPEAFRVLEEIIHPMVREVQEAFLAEARAGDAALALLDIPLLFEGGGERNVDRVVVVTCTPEIQRERVLSRPGMTEEKFAAILARQMPDSQKRQRADFIVDTGSGMEAARMRVDDIIAKLTHGS